MSAGESAEPVWSGRTVAVLGGTGPQGRGLARRWARAGIPVVIGSRSAGRAEETAAAIADATGGRVTGAENARAAEQGDVVVVAVPWDGHRELPGSRLWAKVNPGAGVVVQRDQVEPRP